VAQFVNPFWRTVARNYEAMRANAPQGYMAVVVAYFVGDSTPCLVGVVESRRDDTRLLLHSIIEGADDPNTAHPSDRLIFVDESQLSRVEVIYVSEEPQPRHPVGFRLQELSEEGSD
jgi:hypothetical protein